MERIDKKKWKYAHIFFQCVAVASRPLRFDELAQFLSFDFGAESTPTFQADWQPEDPARIVLSMCSSLLAVVQPEGYDSPIAQFAHYSVQEYLMSARLADTQDIISRFHISMTPAHTIVAQACLGLLLHLDETITTDSLKNFPLTEYAAQYWVDHARIEDVSSKVQDGMKRLFDPGKCQFSVWVWLYDLEYDQHSYDRPGRSERPGKFRATPLHYAAYCGMHDVAKFLIVEHSQDVNARGFDLKETPLHVASRRRHANIAQLLLEHGADGNAQNDHEKTPLILSSANGDVEVTRILLERGADTNILGHGTSPLMSASTEGHAEVVRLLLKHGANANAQVKDTTIPLQIAVLFGHVGTTRVLLEHGLDANARDAYGATLLHLASSGSSRRANLEDRLDLVRLLVQYGSDIHAQDNNGRTPFMLAKLSRFPEIMQLLLEYGAEDHRK